MSFPKIQDVNEVTEVIIVGQFAYYVPEPVAKYIKDFRNNCIVYMNALHGAAESEHSPDCNCVKEDMLEKQELYCTCHVQRARKALALLEKQR